MHKFIIKRHVWGADCLLHNNVSGLKIISDVQQVEEFSLCFSVKRKEVVDGSKLMGFPVRRVKVCHGGEKQTNF